MQYVSAKQNAPLHEMGGHIQAPVAKSPMYLASNPSSTQYLTAIPDTKRHKTALYQGSTTIVFTHACSHPKEERHRSNLYQADTTRRFRERHYIITIHPIPLFSRACSCFVGFILARGNPVWRGQINSHAPMGCFPCWGVSRNGECVASRPPSGPEGRRPRSRNAKECGV